MGSYEAAVFWLVNVRFDEGVELLRLPHASEAASKNHLRDALRGMGFGFQDRRLRRVNQAGFEFRRCHLLCHSLGGGYDISSVIRFAWVA